MLNYELCKKLKYAGFPMGEGFDQAKIPTPQLNHFKETFCDGDFKYWNIPTLVELIEACGPGFISLEQSSGPMSFRTLKTLFWVCSWYQNGRVEEQDWGLYKTPEEAVANLYLKLNEKITT